MPLDLTAYGNSLKFFFLEHFPYCVFCRGKTSQAAVSNQNEEEEDVDVDGEGGGGGGGKSEEETKKRKGRTSSTTERERRRVIELTAHKRPWLDPHYGK